MSKTKINIYYHSDIDGVFSAILIAKMYLDHNVPVSLTFTEINYDAQETWQKNPLCKDYDINVVVDFLYHKDADVWYDHHKSGWGEVEPHTNFKGSFDDTAPSCARVILNDINRPMLKNEDFLRQIIAGVDVVDQAQYSSPEDPYNMNLWHSALRLAFMHEGNNAFQQELIKLFLYNDASFRRLKNNVIPEIAEWRAAKALYYIEKSYEGFKDICQLENGVVHYTIPEYKKFDRYFAFRLHKAAHYSVYTRDNTWRNQGATISIGKNPFITQDPSVNIKDICAHYGGGGHEAVGGIPVATIEEAERIKKDVVAMLSESVSKYIAITGG